MAVSAGPPAGRFTPLDVLSLFYFGVTAALLALPHRPPDWPGILIFHGLFLAGVPLLVRFQGRNGFLTFLRNWYPLFALIFLYSELKDLNQILVHGYFDRFVMAWETGLFRHHLSQTLRVWIPWKPLGEAVHLGYFSYYFTLPALFPALWILGRRAQFHIALTVVMAVYYFCYLWYVFFPVTGPYWQFPHPDPNTMGWFFPQLTHGIVAAGSSRGSAFPSSHVAAAVTVTGMAHRYLRPVFWILLLPVTLLTIGTVYGGFHYGVDALAGLLVGLTATWAGPRALKEWEKRA